MSFPCISFHSFTFLLFNSFHTFHSFPFISYISIYLIHFHYISFHFISFQSSFPLFCLDVLSCQCPSSPHSSITSHNLCSLTQRSHHLLLLYALHLASITKYVHKSHVCTTTWRFHAGVSHT